eukprot:6210454-Pleurochrysis_carterae.AAC.2
MSWAHLVPKERTESRLASAEEEGGVYLHLTSVDETICLVNIISNFQVMQGLQVCRILTNADRLWRNTARAAQIVPIINSFILSTSFVHLRCGQDTHRCEVLHVKSAVRLVPLSRRAASRAVKPTTNTKLIATTATTHVVNGSAQRRLVSQASLSEVQWR